MPPLMVRFAPVSDTVALKCPRQKMLFSQLFYNQLPHFVRVWMALTSHSRILYDESVSHTFHENDEDTYRIEPSRLRTPEGW